MRCIRENPLLERYRGDAAFRARASLAASLAMGIVMIRRANEAIRTLKQKEHLK